MKPSKEGEQKFEGKFRLNKKSISKPSSAPDSWNEESGKNTPQLKVIWEYEASTEAKERILAVLEMILGDVNNIEIVDNIPFTKPYAGFSMAYNGSKIREKRISHGRRGIQANRHEYSDSSPLG